MDVRRLLHAILTCVTAGPGLGFNRAVLFLADEAGERLEATMAIGPGSAEEAAEAWARFGDVAYSLDDLLRQTSVAEPRTSFQRQVEGLKIDLGSLEAATGADNPLLEAYRCRRVVKIVDSEALGRIPPSLRTVFAGTEVACVPLVAHERTVGLLIADNAFTQTPITEERVRLLQVLALLAGQALDGARLYRQLERQTDELRLALTDLRSAQEKLLHSERLATVGAVVARVSHEIRNPLSTIGGFARSLAKHPTDTERVRRNTGIIVSEVEKLEGLLKEMLDFTSPRPPRLAKADINDVLRDLVNVHGEEFAARRVAIETRLQSQAPAFDLDANQIQRALLNLMQNGAQAMDEVAEEAGRHLLLRTWSDEANVFVSVRDRGTGVSPDVMPRIFTPFFTTKARGTGLGLAVVKKIVDDHKGTIDIQSRPGLGTEFVLALPLPR